MPADDLEGLVEEHIQEAEMTCTTATLKAIDGRKTIPQEVSNQVRQTVQGLQV